jgi:hypothetical protein
LRPGSYQVVASANQYLQGQVEPFAVGESENYLVGDLALVSFPVIFGSAQPCSLPADGGVCNFSVQITNGLSTRLSGKAWSVINGSGLGSFVDFTNFQTDTPRDVKLDPGRSTTLRFRFRVPDSVADGATICAVVYVGHNPEALFNPAGFHLAFCLTKGENSFTLKTPQNAETELQHMQNRPPASPIPLSDKKK